MTTTRTAIGLVSSLRPFTARPSVFLARPLHIPRRHLRLPRKMPVQPITDKVQELANDPRAKEAGGMLKNVENSIWKAMEPVGRAVNNAAAGVGAEAIWPTELAGGEIDKAARILRTFTLDGAETEANPAAEASATEVEKEATQIEMQRQAQQKEMAANEPEDKAASRRRQQVLAKIPAKAIRDAHGIAIMTCFRTGFVISGSSGSGVVVSRLKDGSWSPPSGFLVKTVGYGFLAGLDIYDVVLVLRTPEAVQSFYNPKVTVGAELSVAAGPVGNGAVLDSGIEASPCWSYTKSKGLYAGAQLDGTIILARDDANSRLYGKQVTAADLLMAHDVQAPDAVKPLWQTLYAAEGRADVMGTDLIPQGAAPGEKEISPQEADEFKAKEKGDQVVQEAKQSMPEQPAVPGSAPGTATGAKQK